MTGFSALRDDLAHDVDALGLEPLQMREPGGRGAERRPGSSVAVARTLTQSRSSCGSRRWLRVGGAGAGRIPSSPPAPTTSGRRARARRRARRGCRARSRSRRSRGRAARCRECRCRRRNATTSLARPIGERIDLDQRRAPHPTRRTASRRGPRLLGAQAGDPAGGAGERALERLDLADVRSTPCAPRPSARKPLMPCCGDQLFERAGASGAKARMRRRSAPRSPPRHRRSRETAGRCRGSTTSIGESAVKIAWAIAWSSRPKLVVKTIRPATVSRARSSRAARPVRSSSTDICRMQNSLRGIAGIRRRIEGKSWRERRGIRPSELIPSLQ